VADDRLICETDPGFLSASAAAAGVFARSASRQRDHQTISSTSVAASPADHLRAAALSRRASSLAQLRRHAGDLLTGGAEDFKIMTAPLAAPGRENWRELVAHRPGTIVLDVGVLADWLVRFERHDGLPRIVVRRLTDGDEHTIAFA
jgi:oligopeptidase B